MFDKKKLILWYSLVELYMVCKNEIKTTSTNTLNYNTDRNEPNYFSGNEKDRNRTVANKYV